MQIAFAIAQRFQCANGFNDVVAIGAGTAVTHTNVMQTFIKGQPPGILYVTAINDEAERPHLAPGVFLKLDAPHGFQINGGNLLACAQVSYRCGARRGGDPKRDATAHSTAVKPEHQSRPLWRTAMNERIDAERAV